MAVCDSTATNGAVSLPPDAPSPEWMLVLAQSLEEATRLPASAMRSILPPQVVVQLCTKLLSKFKSESTLVEVVATPPGCTITVVGDTHGQYHDLCRLFEVAGLPSQDRVYVFNGDYVDRGAWGLETLVLLLGWKWTLPSNVFMLRGNHESTTCTSFYGFYSELLAKYDAANAKALYSVFKKIFAVMPLAARIERSTLVLHGGLFRRPPRVHGKRRRNSLPTSTASLELGSLEDLRQASKGGVDPDGTGASVIAADVLWSDPVAEDGLRANESRGVGLVFGPDMTQKFLDENGLKLIIRSHEGPDARHQRTDMQQMHEGYTVDHVVPAGRLMTVFSAPDYPQFQAGSDRFYNRGAVAVLSAPDYTTPSMQQFDAAPRPEAEPYYSLDVEFEEEDEPAVNQPNGDCTAHTDPVRSTMHDGLDKENDADAGQASSQPSAQPSQGLEHMEWVEQPGLHTEPEALDQVNGICDSCQVCDLDPSSPCSQVRSNAGLKADQVAVPAEESLLQGNGHGEEYCTHSSAETQLALGNTEPELQGSCVEEAVQDCLSSMLQAVFGDPGAIDNDCEGAGQEPLACLALQPVP